jgi:hypothetical protein
MRDRDENVQHGTPEAAALGTSLQRGEQTQWRGKKKDRRAAVFDNGYAASFSSSPWF